MPCTCSNIEEKSSLSFVHTAHSILCQCNYMLPFNFMHFQKKYQTPRKTSKPGDPASKNSSVMVSSKSTSRAMSKLLSEMAQPTDYPAETSDKFYIFLSHRQQTQNNTASYPRTYHYPNFLRVSQISHHPCTTGINLQNIIPTFPRSEIGDFWLYGLLSMFLIIQGVD